jgi:hypothetical protein
LVRAVLSKPGVERLTSFVVTLVLAGLGGRASAGPLPGFALVGSTQSFVVYSRDGRGLDGDKSERYLKRLEALFGSGVAGRVEYYRCERPEDVAALTGLYASGVTSAHERRIISTRGFHAHELVHLVAGQVGSGGVFFDEGLAVALSDEAGFRKADVDRVARRLGGRQRVSEIATRFADLPPETAYALAGSFVGFLLEAYGIERVTRFLSQCGPSAPEQAAAFERVFGVSLDAAGEAWKARTAAEHPRAS